MGKAWVLTIGMGYGHQRAAYPLKDIAYPRVIDVNEDSIISARERKFWSRSRRSYEWVSRMQEFPIIGKLVFGAFDNVQAIAPLFPLRDLSKPTYWARLIRYSIERKELCKDLVATISETDLPVITTFPTLAMAMEYHGLKNKLYCVVTDSDVNRIWVSTEPSKSRIIYMTPCKHVMMRLKEYGVPEENMILTGFPLPKENIGKSQGILKKDIRERISNLDPGRRFIDLNNPVLKRSLGGSIPKKSGRKLTICYLVGGAGAQKETGIIIAKSLKQSILKNRIRLILVAGTRPDVEKYFKLRLKMIGLESRLGKNLRILYQEDKQEYFKELNSELRHTDLVWTKPSEMSFYAALGIPIIMTRPLGSHEGYNKAWLEHIGAGIKGGDPRYTQEWLDYWLESGRLAHSAFDGFLEALNMGTYNIESVIDGDDEKTIFER